MVRFLYLLLLTLTGCIVLNYFLVELVAFSRIESNTAALKNYTCVLIPGAGNSPLGEWQNPVFSARLNACVRLHSQIPVNHITCSGLVQPPFYNEPEDMKNFLLTKGIPGTIIQLDNLGHNTFTTVKNYTGQGACKNVIIISQRIHLARAIYAARIFGLDAKGYSAGNYPRYKNEFVIYEALARFKLTLQLLFL